MLWLFTDVRFIREDVLRFCALYQTVFDGTAEGDEVHSSLVAGGVTFTFSYVAPLQKNSVFHYVSAGGANNVRILKIEGRLAVVELKREDMAMGPPARHRIVFDETVRLNTEERLYRVDKTTIN